MRLEPTSTELVDGITPGEAAHRLGVSPATVRIWADRGLLDCVKTRLGRLLDPLSVENLRQEREDGRDDTTR